MKNKNQDVASNTDSEKDQEATWYTKVGNTHMPVSRKGARMMIWAKLVGFVIFLLILLVIYLFNN